MPCDHPKLQKERIGGEPTGDYVCLTCGKIGRASAWVHRDRAANRRAARPVPSHPERR